MPIRVICRQCAKQFSAWDDLRGKSVQCPKCNAEMIVPGSSHAATPSAGALPARSSSSELSPKDLASLEEAVDDLPSLEEILPASPDKAAPVESPPGSNRPLSRQLTPPAPPPITSASVRDPVPKRAISSAESTNKLDDSDALPISCPNCNQYQPAGEDMCNACGYHRILEKVLDMDGIHQTDRTTGFERLLKQQLSDGETAENALLWTKIVAAIGVLALLGFVGVCMGPIAAIICLVCLGALVVWMMRQKKDRGNSAVNQDLISAAIWTGFLTLQRAFGWRLLLWPFPRTSVLTMHDSSFTDDDLTEMNNLQSFQTLDLERTQVSDGGLLHLERMTQLKYLVLRQTRVTTSGIQRLQAKLDQTMIWY